MLPFANNIDNDINNIPNQPNFIKAKRKRLAKACDACHKSKRRCDGTAPCSNCYYASKSCTYTDSSGRPVPAPRPFNPERNDSQPSLDMHPQSFGTIYTEPSRYNQPVHSTNGYSSNSSSPSQITSSVVCKDDAGNNRKRIKNERGNPIPAEDATTDGPISGPSMDRPIPVKLDHSLTRELTNLFFTHCHPARIIIHKPSFSTALSHNQIPGYLIHAICALAAPLSKQPRIRTNPARFAGKPFAQEAMSIMFDGAGRLVCEANLATAQALCLLQIHDIVTKDKNMYWNTRYHDLALQIVKSLGVQSPDHPLLTPLPSPEFIHASLERESVRRIFWLIQMLDVMISIYFKRPLAISDNELRVRLPADETSFELAVHSTLPEYLHLPPIKTQYASEFGHLIRVLMIYSKVEYALDHLTGLKESDSSINPTSLIHEAEQKIREWSSLLPDHLNFSKENHSVQQSMFETSSNDGAWCYCCMHVYHASTFIALNNAQQLLQGAPSLQVGPQWAIDMLDEILTMLGERGKHSLLMSATLWTYAGLCGRDDSQIYVMANDYEEYWGTRMLDLVQNWRSRMSPSKQQLHQFITPPQKYAQSLKRRHQAQGGTDISLPSVQSTNRLSPAGRSSARSVVLDSTTAPSQTTYQSDDIPNQAATTSIQVMLQSSSDSPRTRIASMQVSSKRQSPLLLTSNSLRHSEDVRRLSSNDPRWHKQLDATASTALLTDPGQEIIQQSNGECQARTMAQKISWDRDQSQVVAVKSEGSKPNSSETNATGSQQDQTIEGIHGVSKGNQRSHSMTVTSEDALQSLPSLKASGLLDSWTTSRSSEKVASQGQPSGILEALPQQSALTVLQQKQGRNIDVSRHMPPVATSGMPVGLQWLANESR